MTFRPKIDKWQKTYINKTIGKNYSRSKIKVLAIIDMRAAFDTVEGEKKERTHDTVKSTETWSPFD